MYFSVYEHTLVYDNDKLLTRKFIVLKDSNGNIIRWTDFHRYARAGKTSRVQSISSDSGMRCYDAVKLLNYVFFGKYHIQKLTEITPAMVCDFFNDYGLCRLPGDNEYTHRQKATVEKCISHILDFLDFMVRDNPNCKMRLDHLFRTEQVFSKKKKRYVEKRVPIFEVLYKSKARPLPRNIPEGAFQIIMNEIVANHKSILMLAALSAFAGLRPSESCNVRRADSPLGAGLRFEMVDGEVMNIYIDLTEEKNLRSDLISVGKIKKERTQKVYPAFLEVFCQCYNTYMKYMEGKTYEAEYGALSTISTGKARTYASYYQEFRSVVKDCIPIMLANDDPEVINYAHLLQEKDIAPHILRHWYSVKLTLNGEDVASLMHWRGDTSPESALTYLMNKSELEKQYEKVSDEVFNYSLWKADKLMGKEDDG